MQLVLLLYWLHHKSLWFLLTNYLDYLFLKQLKVSNFSATIGALLFSFSGFMIIGSCWYVFTYEAFTLAMALLGFELYFQKNKWLVFVLSIALIGISMPFNLYFGADVNVDKSIIKSKFLKISSTVFINFF